MITQLRATLTFPWSQLVLCEERRNKLHRELTEEIGRCPAGANILMYQLDGVYDSDMLDQLSLTKDLIICIARVVKSDAFENKLHDALDEILDYCATGSALIGLTIKVTVEQPVAAAPRGRKKR